MVANTNGESVTLTPGRTRQVNHNISNIIRYMLSYQKLFSGPNTRIAKFQKLSQATPIGPSHGTLQYSFSHDLLLLEALITLNLNRWLDWTG